MVTDMLKFMSFMMFLLGVAVIGGSGWLCYISNKEWGWFLFAGFFITCISGQMAIEANKKK
jgi:hypothetical protein